MRQILKLLLLPVLVAALSACSEVEVESKPVRPAQVWEVGEGPSSTVSTYSGQVHARYETDLAFRVNGKVISRSVELGDRISPNKILAQLDTSDLNLQVASTEASLQAARSELVTARDELKRIRDLFKKNFISQTAVDNQRNRYRAAQSQVKSAQAQLDLAKNQSDYSNLKSDSAGVVTKIDIEAGQVISAGQPVIRIAQEGEYEVHIRVGEQAVKNLQPGQSVIVSLWADKEASLPGEIRDIAPAADDNRTWLIKVSLFNSNAGLKSGMTAKVLFKTENSHQLTWLPATALFQQDKQPAVWIVTADQRVKLQRIKLERYLENGILVSGLDKGQQIVAAGVNRLHPGQAIQPIAYTGKAHHDMPNAQ
ncbi:MAG: efflux RND transporter periplasmic adaptor subunit [Candidatus Thiodiazotropha sp. (ex Codakia rugifera)]|nr:efflux RND transporter periplasmic adaptor subunit [Candidatus Thiodiazotropha sp. (ex Codakia rugifera)]